MSAICNTIDLSISAHWNESQWERFWEEERSYDGIGVAASSESFAYSERPETLTAEELAELRFVDIGSELLRLRSLESAELYERLNELSSSHTRDWLEHNYFKVRPEYCALQVELNARHVNGEPGASSPAFRPHLPLSPKPKYGLADLSNDTQLIDLHFLHLNGCRAAHCSFADKALAGEDFGFDDGFRFCNRGGSGRKKLTLLQFDEKPQDRHLELWGLQSIKEADAKSQTREYRRLLRSIEARLRKATTRKSADVRLWAALVVANKIVSDSELEVSPANLKFVTQLLIGPVSAHPRTLKQKLDNALKRL